MAKGLKTGGRQKGTANKKTALVQEILFNNNCDPIEGMILIAQDTSHTPELRGKMFSELAQYIYPKRKSIEQRTEVFQTISDAPMKTDDEWANEYKIQ